MIKKSIIYFLLSATILYAVSGFAQPATLTGRITDADTGSPLFGANVVLSSIPDAVQLFGSSSNLSGDYQIRGIIPGMYTITVSFIGYKSFVADSTGFAPGEVRRMNFALEPSVLESRQVEVSATRRSINPLESTSFITIIDTLQLTSIQPMTLSDHLVGLAGVDVLKTGISQSNVAFRGFNDVFSGSLLLMVDNRIGRVPSLRFNAFNFLPTSNEDIERIEIIRGPASALYGPNSANGVMNIITKSPFGSEGTALNFGLGQRNIFTFDFRHAGSYGNTVGYKITGSFMQGDDFVSRDAFEDSLRSSIIENSNELFEKGLELPIDPTRLRIGIRNFLIEKFAGTARVDYRINDETTFIVNGGVNWATNIELTKIGAAQIDNWRYLYGQTQLFYKNMSMQAFANTSNSGETYLTRDGNDLKDRSKFYAYQFQNAHILAGQYKFTYGFDALWTRPETDSTVNGLNEDDDNIDEMGMYLMSESDLANKVKLVAAGRIDKNSRMEDLFISTRAGLVFSPNTNSNVTFTFNRAFSTPTVENMFLDRLVSPLSGRKNPFSIRVRGVPSNGFTFRRDSGGGIDGLYMQAAPFLRPPPGNIGFIAADATLLWSEVVEILNRIKGSGLDFVFKELRNRPAPSSSDIKTVLKFLNTSTGKYETIDPSSIKNIDELESTRTHSFELGYKGILERNLLINANLYYSRIKNFIGPLHLETPNVFFDRETLRDYLAGIGLTGLNAHTIISKIISEIPLGTITPDQSIHPGDVMLTYRNFGDIDLLGLDMDFTYSMTPNINLTGAFSLMSKDVFKNVDGIRDIALNASKSKFNLGIEYYEPGSGFDSRFRFRFMRGFPVNSGVYVGDVESFGIVDFSSGIDIPGETGIRLTVTVQNLFDNVHREFVGAPEIGRFAHLQVKFFLDKYK